MNTKQQAFLKLYLGRNARYHGNGTRCYKKAYDCTDDRVAQSSSSRLLRKPEIAKAVKAYRERAAEQIGVDAAFVLHQSVRLYDRAMGDETVEVDHVTSSGLVETREIREHQPAIAVKALELIGKHTSVQAFQDNVEHTHTHRLEQALSRKQKQVEQKALSDPRVIDGNATIIDAAPAPGRAGEAKKRVHIEGGQSAARSAPEKTSSERRGAPGE